jgi:acyl carrier protein
MDSLNFAIGIHEQLGVDIPEADWASLYTLDEVIDYVVARPAA